MSICMVVRNLAHLYIVDMERVPVERPPAYGRDQQTREKLPHTQHPSRLNCLNHSINRE